MESGNNNPFSAIFDEAQATESTTPDSTARKEEEGINSARNGVRREIHSLVKWGLRLGAVLLAAVITVRFWHLGAPTDWRWLSDTDVQTIDKMLFSSAFGGMVLNYLRSAAEPSSGNKGSS